jgi:hypothetical protein
VRKLACALPLAASGAGAVSPDGRWLIADGSDGKQAILVDLETAFTGNPTTREAGPRLGGDAVWTGADTLLYAAEDGTLIRLRIDRSAADSAQTERVDVPGVVAGTRPVIVVRLSS